MTDEYVMVVDAGNRPAGAAPRSRMRAQNLFHRAAYVLVFNSKGELFRHRRTLTKDIYPGYYDITAGGVVLSGETHEAAAARELEEETGIRDTPLAFLFDLFFEDPKSRVFGRVFRCVFDGKITLQKEEIIDGAFLSIQQILADAEHLPYTPDGRMILKRLSSELNITI